MARLPTTAPTGTPTSELTVKMSSTGDVLAEGTAAVATSPAVQFGEPIPGPRGIQGEQGIQGPVGPPGPDTVEALAVHIDDETPHPAYDDLPSLVLIFNNGLV